MNIDLRKTYNSMLKKDLVDMLVNDRGLVVALSDDIVRYVQGASDLVANWNKEHFIVIMLNAKNKIIGKEIISMGHLTASLVHPREIFAAILAVGGVAGFICLHNHPSGDPAPSVNDDKITKLVENAGKLMNVYMLDHIIFTRDSNYFYSYNDEGSIPAIRR